VLVSYFQAYWRDFNLRHDALLYCGSFDAKR
jgi:hypothetical protein